MEIGGNNRVNDAFEACLTSKKAAQVKPNTKSDLEVRDQFIKAKYRERAFFDATMYETGDLAAAAATSAVGIPEADVAPKIDPNLFVGMSDENFFSDSKTNLFLIASPVKQPDNSLKSSQGGFAKASKEDIEHLLFSSDDVQSISSEKGPSSSGKLTNSVGRKGRRNEESDDEYHVPLRCDESQSTESSTTSSKNPKSVHSGRRASSKSRKTEGRSLSRSRARGGSRSRSHDKSENSPDGADGFRRTGESKSPVRNHQRSSSQSRRSHMKDASSGGKMRRSSSGQSLDDQPSSHSRMRRSGGSGHSLEKGSAHSSPHSRMRRISSGHSLEKGKLPPRSHHGMRRCVSGNGLEEQPPPSSSRSAGRNSGSSMHRNMSGDALRAQSSHGGNRRSADLLSAVYLRKERRSTDIGQMRNATFDMIKTTEHSLLPSDGEKPSSSNSMLPGRRELVLRKDRLLQECETTLAQPSQKSPKAELLGSGSSHGHPRSAPPRRQVQPTCSHSRTEDRNASLGSASTHGAKSRWIRKQAANANAGANADRVLRLFAASSTSSSETDENPTSFKQLDDRECETDQTLSSSEGSLPIHSPGALSEQAQKAMADLKVILQQGED